MKYRLLIVLSFFSLVSMMQLVGSSSSQLADSSSPVTVTEVDGLGNTTIVQQPEAFGGSLDTQVRILPPKQIRNKKATQLKSSSSDQPIKQRNRAIAGGSVVSVSGPKEITSSHNSDNFSLSENQPLSVQATVAQSAPVSNVKTKAAIFESQKTKVAPSYKASNVPVQSGHVGRLGANFKQNNAAPAEQAAPQNLNNPDVAFENIYNPESMDQAVVHNDDNSLNVNMGTIYDEPAVESGENAMYVQAPSISDEPKASVVSNNQGASQSRFATSVQRPVSVTDHALQSENITNQSQVSSSGSVNLGEVFSYEPVNNNQPENNVDDVSVGSNNSAQSSFSLKRPMTAEDLFKTKSNVANQGVSQTNLSKSDSVWQQLVNLVMKAGVKMNDFASFCKNNVSDLVSYLQRSNHSEVVPMVQEAAQGKLTLSSFTRIKNYILSIVGIKSSNDVKASSEEPSFELGDIYAGSDDKEFTIGNPMQNTVAQNSKTIVSPATQDKPVPGESMPAPSMAAIYPDLEAKDFAGVNPIYKPKPQSKSMGM